VDKKQADEIWEALDEILRVWMRRRRVHEFHSAGHDEELKRIALEIMHRKLHA